MVCAFAGNVVNMGEAKVVRAPSAHAIKAFEARCESFPVILLNEAK